MNNKKNFITAIILQFVTIISGLILPRLILSTFNSEINGLVSSITQFLSFISLAEGGLGAVVLAELYKPIEFKDDKKIKQILTECQNYFSKLTIIFIIYTIVLSIVYPLICKSQFSFSFVNSLVIILSFSTLIKYLFSITYKLYLQASQKIYIVNICSTVITLLNLIVIFIIIKFTPSIHIIKIVADLLFIIQPIIFKKIVEKKYHVKLCLKKSNKKILKDRWSGFAQNLAHYVNMNTDICVVTLLVGIKDVSIYSIYMLPIAALRNLISLISNIYQSVLGKYYAKDDIDILKSNFIKLQNINWVVSLILYGTCFLLIDDFVKIYTIGINDANYYQPLFSGIMILATLLYSILEPQKFLILSVGKFKDIKKIYIVEAILNIVISIVLSIKFGLIGTALGTLIAVIYRFAYFILYLRKNIINIEIKNYVYPLLMTIFVIIINIYFHYNYILNINNFYEFIIYGFLMFIVEAILVIICFRKYILRSLKAKKDA